MFRSTTRICTACLTARSLDDLGLDEVAQDGVLAIEWPERLSRGVPGAIDVRIDITGETSRPITIDDRWARSPSALRTHDAAPAASAARRPPSRRRRGPSRGVRTDAAVSTVAVLGPEGGRQHEDVGTDDRRGLRHQAIGEPQARAGHLDATKRGLAAA